MSKTEEQIREELNSELRGSASLGPDESDELGQTSIQVGGENPFEEGTEIGEVFGVADNMYGAFSMNKYCDQAALSGRNGDAAGWLNYVEKFNKRNFWYTDGNVMIWAYYDPYDNWQDTYGIDAARAVYHSGHGNTLGDGTFICSMGANWSNWGCTAYSNKMVLGDEKLRYLFWSSCLSCRVSGGHSPMRTWSVPNRGMRMIFGFDSVTWDNSVLGAWFFDEWNKNKSFSSAWIDANWKITHNHSPSVTACGATKEEAINRVFNERLFYGSPVSSNWWWWVWRNLATTAREPNLSVPKEILAVNLQPAEIDEKSIRAVSSRFDLDVDLPKRIASVGPSVYMAKGGRQVAFGKEGSYEVQLSGPNRSNKEQISFSGAKAKARDTLSRFGLAQEVDLALDSISLESGAGSSKDGKGAEGPFVTQTIVHFKQLINGIPIITPGLGEIGVSIDNDGSATRVQSSIRPVELVRAHPRLTTETPPEEGSTHPKEAKQKGYEQLLAKGIKDFLATLIVRGSMPVQYTTVPGTTEIGYEVRDDETYLAIRRGIEVDFGNGFHMRYWIVVPIE